jgi:hypothetical protein
MHRNRVLWFRSVRPDRGQIGERKRKGRERQGAEARTELEQLSHNPAIRFGWGPDSKVCVPLRRAAERMSGSWSTGKSMILE